MKNEDIKRIADKYFPVGDSVMMARDALINARTALQEGCDPKLIMSAVEEIGETVAGLLAAIEIERIRLKSKRGGYSK